mmetsp:Transcript_48137/g.109113  ORF Transcript_48137/g.109113 Transcript_48137/m.109113 type:complete len:1165 (-) Transcript_48137:166-3660(-)|eukprot:CAMPEP_0204321718 /NCGR_PEP_ID=MMETSP0469-20131031/8314_1 /ASSEMBLY_ACC=CAM_ASM_000384 /TAXON_ID=2969 /ORGANISM="Oxyrrhis marina" /LENGTH=1164 /DNA_ID=CAMNT_0051303039 /DNA_START=46 /DNA_END=3540 /DNA_ORIENTATION=-
MAVAQRHVGPGPAAAEETVVIVRLRPPAGEDDENAVSVDGCRVTVDQGSQTSQFSFDCVVHDDGVSGVGQEELYARVGPHLVRSVQEGCGGCVLAYGSSGSGKTHSVFGSRKEPGILPRFGVDAFDMAALWRSQGGDACVCVSLLEIHGEIITDLLVPPDQDRPFGLELYQHPEFGVYVPSLSVNAVHNFDELSELVDFAKKRRCLAATSLSSRSSRTHTVCILSICGIPVGEAGTTAGVPKVTLVDLAASAREDEPTEWPDLASVTHLQVVIARLSERDGEMWDGFGIPFRDYKLTFLLSDSLGGTTRTVLVANIRSEASYAAETMHTLSFARTAQSVTSYPARVSCNTDKVIQSLRGEIEQLQIRLRSAETGDIDVIRAEIEERDKLISSFVMDGRAVVERTRAVDELRKEYLEMHCVASQSSARLQPHLVNISDDPALSGCLLYALVPGADVLVGESVHAGIRIRGQGVSEEVGVLRNENDGTLSVIVARDGEVRVNGTAISREGRASVYHNDRIVFGRAFAFRVVVPEARAADEGAADPAEHKHVLRQLEANTDVDEALQTFVEDLQAQHGGNTSEEFLALYRSIRFCVDEANDITMTLMQDDRLFFSVECLAGRQARPQDAVVVRVLQQVVSEDGAASLLPFYVWEVRKFLERLEIMRALLHEYLQFGAVGVVSAERDPWRELTPAQWHYTERIMRQQACPDCAQRQAHDAAEPNGEKEDKPAVARVQPKAKATVSRRPVHDVRKNGKAAPLAQPRRATRGPDEETKRKLQALEEDNRRLREDNHRLKEQAKDTGKVEQLEALDRKYSQLASSYHVASAHAHQLTEQVDSLEIANTRLKRQLKESQERLAEATETISEFEKPKPAVAGTELEDKINKLLAGQSSIMSTISTSGAVGLTASHMSGSHSARSNQTEIDELRLKLSTVEAVMREKTVLLDALMSQVKSGQDKQGEVAHIIQRNTEALKSVQRLVPTSPLVTLTGDGAHPEWNGPGGRSVFGDGKKDWFEGMPVSPRRAISPVGAARPLGPMGSAPDLAQRAAASHPAGHAMSHMSPMDLRRGPAARHAEDPASFVDSSTRQAQPGGVLRQVSAPSLGEPSSARARPQRVVPGTIGAYLNGLQSRSPVRDRTPVSPTYQTLPHVQYHGVRHASPRAVQPVPRR